jgi:hypothetical protein
MEKETTIVGSLTCVCGKQVDITEDAEGENTLLHPMPPCPLYIEIDDPGAYLEAVRTRRGNLS